MDDLDLEKFKSCFQKHVHDTLHLFPNTIGQCVSLCACISSKLSIDEIPHVVALGSLSCNGIKTFQYVRAFPSNPTKPISWDGHAWLEFPNGFIGEPSLLRTARAQESISNLRRHFENLGMLDRGAFLMDKQARHDAGLKYTRKSILNEKMIPSLVKGLISLNQ